MTLLYDEYRKILIKKEEIRKKTTAAYIQFDRHELNDFIK